MAAEDAAVGVQFIQDNVAKVFEEARPARVMRQNSRVQHVRIGEDDVAFFANGTARVRGSITVVSENAEAIFQALVEVVKFGKLILSKGLCREEIQRARV